MNVIFKVPIRAEVLVTCGTPFVGMPRCKVQLQRHNRLEALAAQRTLEADVILDQMVLQVVVFGEGVVTFAT